MLKCYKTEIKPTCLQKQKIHQTIGTCRYVYNLYIAHNQGIYETEKRFVTGYTFQKWLNNEFLPNNPDCKWIKEASSKSVKQSIMNAERAFRKFFKKESKFPRFKKKNKSDVKMYFVRNGANCIIPCERHRIKIPTLGWIKLKEKGYIPSNDDNHIIKSGTISYHAGRYYISVLVDVHETTEVTENNGEPIGIDLGLKDFAVMSNGTTKKNINKTYKIKKLEKQLKREHRCLSRKYEDYKKRKKYITGGKATRQNIQKQAMKVQILHHKLDCIRTDYINQTIAEIVKTKPSHISIEDLNVKGMMKNRHLSKTIASQKFYEFRTKLQAKCISKGIELRIVDRWYPSSKMCHQCGSIKTNLKLSDRTYTCECGYIADRDYNASLNLRDAVTYVIA